MHLGLLLLIASPSPTLEPASRAGGLGFIENKGQWDRRGRFVLEGSDVAFWVTSDGVSLDFRGADKRHNVRVKFAGSQASSPIGVGEKPGKLNYFVGDEKLWATNVRHFEEIAVPNLYQGISARYYTDKGSPRYDLIVAPGGEPAKIKMSFEGASSLKVDEKGDLQIGTSLGLANMAGLYAYQGQGTAKKEVPCKMVVNGDSISFNLGNYDKTKTLVIDPMVFTSYVGGTGAEKQSRVVADSAGNVIVAGATNSTDFPVTIGAADLSPNGNFDIFVFKLTPDGSALIAGTYLGGSDIEDCGGLDVDSADNIVVGGVTKSTNFPLTSEAFQSAFGQDDAFVSKISASGSALLWSTRYRGGLAETLTALAVGSNDQVTIAGLTRSNDIPTSAGSFDQTLGGQADIYIARLAEDGKSLIFGTYMGGDTGDTVGGLCVDTAGNTILCGATLMGIFTTAGSFDTTFSGNGNGYIAKLTNVGALTFATYVGGSMTGFNGVDLAGNDVVFVGTTRDTTFPMVAGAFDNSHNGETDAVIGKLSSNGASLLASTFLGSLGVDFGNDVKVTPGGSIVIVGRTNDATVPVPVTDPPSIAYGGDIDGIVHHFTSQLDACLYGSYSGGGGQDIFERVAINQGQALVTGTTTSGNLKTLSNSFDKQLSGSSDIVLISHALTNPPLIDLILRDNAGISGGQTTSVVGGSPFTARPVLAGPAVSNLFVTLADNTTAINTPGSVFVLAGDSGASATCLTNPVGATALRTVTATLGNVSITRNVQLVATTFLLRDAANNTSATSIKVVSGQSFAGIVSLSTTLQRPLTVGFLDDTTFIQSPSTATIPAGQTTVTATFGTTQVGTSATRSVTLKLDNLTSTRSVELLLKPNLTTFTLNPTTVVGGNPTTGTVTLTSVAGPGGTSVTLTDNSASIQTPASVTVPAGATQATFQATTSPVTATANRQITASLTGIFRTASLTITPP